ncbi:MAG TPA: FAD-binding oxidoreductase [Geminicoccaceae bacterium]|nr:FAD-binding oxidoreductase [Geminicoccaceae bacterium]
MADIGNLKAALGDIPLVTDRARIQLKSRDFYWYSPVLKRQLDEVCADLVAEPANEAEVVRILAACHRHRVPVTVRGGGSGNYGQAMPLRGGVVLDMSRLDQVLEIGFGRVRAQAGAKLAKIDQACQEHSRQELRFHPSTLKMGTIGGFVAGGSSGVGSITWGTLRDRGNILGLRVLTLEAEPRTIELAGDAVQNVNHAYGTNGVITAVDMPLAPAWPWVDLIVGFEDFMTAVRFADALARQDGLVKKLVTPLAAPLAELYFRPLQSRIPKGANVVLLMIAEPWLDAFRDCLAAWPGRILLERAAADPRRRALPIYELSWNHTTLHALRIDPTITYLQVLYPPPAHVEHIEQMYRCFGEEVMIHLEFVRYDGQIACFGLPIVRFTGEKRLDEIIRLHEEHGCPIFNPHAFTLEEGGMKQVDESHLAFKRHADPLGLLNPGKMIGWDNPDYAGMSRQSYLYASLARL